MASETAGSREVAVHHDVRVTAAELEESIWTNLVGTFDANRLTWERALADIAKVSMLRKMDMILDHKVRMELVKVQESMTDG